MKKARICLMAVAAVFCALVLSPGVTRADELTGSTGISWIFGATTFATDTIAAGSSLSCPGASSICAGYSGYGTETFSAGNFFDLVLGFQLSGRRLQRDNERLRVHGALRS